MAKFTVRVELHDADDDDYQALHRYMKAEKFQRTIESGDGEVYQLPPAEYNREGEVSRDNVLEAAKRAAVKTKLSYAILITESKGRTWYGLKEV